MSYDDRYVAYVDILGFRSLVQCISRRPPLYHNVVAALGELEFRSEALLREAREKFDFHKQMFSDGIVPFSD